jgi:hypothetical protein
LIGLTSLWTNGRSLVPPELNRRRASFVLGKIDEILAWEKTNEQERDVRFVDLGRYLCEVRTGQYWRLENLKSFDEFLERRFPESRRKAYYLMTIHEHLTRIPKRELRQIGWTKARELVRVARADGQRFDCAPWVHKASAMPREEFKREVERHLIRAGDRATRNPLFQGVQEPVAGDRTGARNSGVDAWVRQVAWLLLGNDLRGFSGGGESLRGST